MSSVGRIERRSFENLAEQRLLDFETLLLGKRFAAAVYLSVYAVECLLKAHICKVLDLDELPETYEKHHLLTLLLHSGLHRRVQSAANGSVFENLKKLDGLWNPADRARNIRYIDDPLRYNETAAENVKRWLLDLDSGVITWLRSQL